MSYVLFDIGGTNTRVSVSEDLKSFCDPVKFKTPDNFNEGIELMVSAVQGLTKKKIRVDSGGIRGTLDGEKTMMVHDAGGKLTDWDEKPLVETLKKKLKCSVFIESDTALIGLGESHFGAGKRSELMDNHTVSHGVGGGQIEKSNRYYCSFELEPGVKY